MLHKIGMTAIALLLILTVLGCNNDSQNDTQQEEEKVAIVNGEAIYHSEYTQALDLEKAYYLGMGLDLEMEDAQEILTQVEAQVLDNLVNQKVLIQALEEGEYEAERAEIDEKLEEIKAQFEDEAQFEEVLEQNQITLEELEQDLIVQIKLDQYFEDQVGEVTITEEEAQAYYDQVSEGDEEFPEYDQVKGEIEQLLKNEKMQQEISKLVLEMRDQSEIEILI